MVFFPWRPVVSTPLCHDFKPQKYNNKHLVLGPRNNPVNNMFHTEQSPHGNMEFPDL